MSSDNAMRQLPISSGIATNNIVTENLNFTQTTVIHCFIKTQSQKSPLARLVHYIET